MNQSIDRRGLLFGAGAYFVWGLFPIFMAALKPANTFEIVAHRALWSLAVCLIIVAVARGWRRLREVVTDRRLMLRLTAAAALIAVNWAAMVYAVVTDRVAATSLGYYLNPLLTVALAVVLLGEKLRPLRIAAISVGAVAVVVLAVEQGGLPWIALTLAISFALYALIKKGVGAKVNAITGLTVETLVMVPVAGMILWFVAREGAQTFLVRGQNGLGLSHDLLLALTGVWTAGALVLFAAGARRWPLNVIGLLQYIAPTMTFALAVWYFHEPMPPGRWAGFGLVWVALVLITVDSWRSRERRSSGTTAAGEVTEPV